MKLKYTKPALVLELFSMTQSIATGCTAEDPANPNSTVGDPNIWNKQECGWAIDDNIIIWLEAPICNDYAGAEEDIDGICYNNPDGGNLIFAS